MGEIADMMLDGTMDPETGEFNFDGFDGPGFPMARAEAEAFRRNTGWGRKAKGRKERGPYTGDTAFRLPKAWRKKLEKFGTVQANDYWHWQVRRDGKVIADWWPHKQQWRIGGVTRRGHISEFRDALKQAEASDAS